jgi:pimeloyl-ACP methyl ester carboxylesterase
MTLRLGNSYDPETQPPSTRYYVEVFMKLFQSLGFSNFHIMGHHSGASLATEIAATYPSSVLTLCLICTVIMTRAEQIEVNSTANVAFNEPVPDGSHLIKTWDYLGKSGLGGDLAYKQLELIDQIRAWHGKTQIYILCFQAAYVGFI